MTPAPRARGPRRVGRYVLHDRIAAGGMASVHIGRMVGPGGFGRLVAIKRMHAHLAEEGQFVSMFLDEGRIAGRVTHTNVVGVLDVFSDAGELFIVMEYVHGESLAGLLRDVMARGEAVPCEIAAAIAIGVLCGLHAAHEATSEARQPLGIIHRDVSPHNVLLGADGVARVVDFGIAKAVGRIHKTQSGELKGKLSYMAPEQLQGEAVDRRVDLWSASVVLWEMLAGQRLFQGDEATVVIDVLERPIGPPSSRSAGAARLDAVVMRGLCRSLEGRFQSALEMVEALEDAGAVATSRQVAKWADTYLATMLRERSALLATIESTDPNAPALTALRPIAAPLLPPASSQSLAGTPTRASASLPGAHQPIRPQMAARAVRSRPRWLSWALLAGGVVLLASMVGLGFWLGQPDATKPRTRKQTRTASAEAPVDGAPPQPASAGVAPLAAYCPVGNVCADLVAPDPSRVPVLTAVEQSSALARRLDEGAVFLMLHFTGRASAAGLDFSSDRAFLSIQYTSARGVVVVAVLNAMPRGVLFSASRLGHAASLASPPWPPACPFEKALDAAISAGLSTRESLSAGYMSRPGTGPIWLIRGAGADVTVGPACAALEF